jgi:NADH-quinone oxidoreductase subunit H
MEMGTLSLTQIVQAQEAGLHKWLLWQYFPFNFIAFLIFFLGSLAEVNRTPFDIPEAESELVAGFHTEYSGFRFAVFFLSEYTNMFLAALVTVSLFLGGWTSPFGSFMSGGMWGLFWVLAKAWGIIFLQMWLRWSLPRLRVDQLMYVSWKVLTPFGFACIVGVGIWILI